MKIKFLIVSLLFIFSNAKIYSQELNSNGSPYSIFGIGDIIYYTSPRTYSMGIVGASLFGNYINTLNPAAMTKLTATTISLSANYGFLKSASSVKQNEVSNGNVLGFNIGIPFDRQNGWTMILGFNPVSLVNYRIKQQGNSGGQNYTQTYSGKGGLSRISLGMSYNFLDKFNIGLEYNYGFGEIKNQNFINFSNSNYLNTNIKNEYDYQRSYVKGGLIFEVGKIFKSFNLRNMTLGFVFQSGFNLSTTLDGIYRNYLSTDTVRLNQGTIDIPEAYGFGITNIFGNKYLVSGDVMIQDWSKYSIFGESRSNFQKSFRAGLGLEILPHQNYTSFWQAMTYRFGGFYEKAFYQVYGQNINAIGVRVGLNIPISTYSSVDFGINYSVKGNTDNGLIRDEFLNFTAGVNFGELWFIRPKEEDQ